MSEADSPPCLSVAGNNVPSATDISPPGRYTGSPDNLQRQIREVKQQIKALSASKNTVRSGVSRHSLPVGDPAGVGLGDRPTPAESPTVLTHIFGGNEP